MSWFGNLSPDCQLILIISGITGFLPVKSGKFAVFYDFKISENPCLVGGPRARHPRHGGTARPPSKISRLRQARPRPAHDCLTIGTGTPIHVTGVPGVPFLWACRAGRTVTARPGQSLHDRSLWMSSRASLALLAGLVS